MTFHALLLSRSYGVFPHAASLMIPVSSALPAMARCNCHMANILSRYSWTGGRFPPSRMFLLFLIYSFSAHTKTLRSYNDEAQHDCQNGFQFHRLIPQSFLFALDYEERRTAKQQHCSRNHGRDFPPVVIEPQLDALTVWHFDYYGRQR